MDGKEDDTFYEIERILAKRIVKNNQVEYLVYWKGFSIDDSTWEPANRLKEDHCRAYCDSLKEAFLQHDEVVVPMIVKQSTTVKQFYTEPPHLPVATAEGDNFAMERDLHELSQLSNETPLIAGAVDENIVIKCDDIQTVIVSESLRHITGRTSIHEMRIRDSFKADTKNSNT